MTDLVSKYNGIEFDKPAGLSNSEWENTKTSLVNSSGGRLFDTKTEANEDGPRKGTMHLPPSKVMPGTVEFEADRKKAAKSSVEDLVR